MDTLTKEARSRVMAAIRSKHTRPEWLVRRFVHSLGYRYVLHDRRLPGTPDLVFPRLQSAIDVRGCFWHLHTCGKCRLPRSNRAFWKRKLVTNAERDLRVGRALRKAGWRLLVVWECQLHPRKWPATQARIARFLASSE